MSDFTPEQVERAAEALWLSQDGRRVACCSPRKPWAGLAEVTKKICREDALAVLSAADAPEELANLRAGMKHISGRMAEARSTLQYFADRIEEHIFGELASELDDLWCDFETGMPLGAPEKVTPVVGEVGEVPQWLLDAEHQRRMGESK